MPTLSVQTLPTPPYYPGIAPSHEFPGGGRRCYCLPATILRRGIREKQSSDTHTQGCEEEARRLEISRDILRVRRRTRSRHHTKVPNILDYTQQIDASTTESLEECRGWGWTVGEKTIKGWTHPTTTWNLLLSSAEIDTSTLNQRWNVQRTQ